MDVQRDRDRVRERGRERCRRNEGDREIFYIEEQGENNTHCGWTISLQNK